MAGEELSIENIFPGGEGVDIDNLFTGIGEEVEEPAVDAVEKPDDAGGGEDTKKESESAKVNVDNLFTEDSAGDEENKGQEEDTASKSGGTSPKNFYSSIAKALKEEGIFPDLDDDTYGKVETARDFRDLVEAQIKEGLDERQKRIDEALSAGVEPNDIKRYENTVNFLNSISEDAIKAEGANGEKLRKDLIFQDFVNRGYSSERAQKEVQKSLNAGTDIEDAKEALKSNMEFFTQRYKDLVDEAKEEQEAEARERKEQADRLRKSILEDKDVFGDLVVDRNTRQKIIDNLSKPVYRVPESGEYLTAIQRCEYENRTEFLKNIGLIFTLTNGFKNFDGLVKGKVRKEVKKGLSELEKTLNNTSRNSDGSLRFVTGVDDDPDAFIGKGWKLDL